MFCVFLGGEPVQVVESGELGGGARGDSEGGQHGQVLGCSEGL